ncbi:Uncharacterised protein [Vibrio cholerae]|nr:Uncharacterised protein [Vibrio cholerae]CSC41439.1 Uncharacterised protein [Vibrio cholerae]CSC67315.1 Uncharacterised protein [Vibrio cholerae]
MVIKTNPIPFQHGEFWIVVTAIFFVTKSFTQLVNTTTARGQQTLHMKFRASHQMQRAAFGITRPDKFRFKRVQMDVRHRGVAHGWRFDFQHIALSKKFTNLTQQGRALF